MEFQLHTMTERILPPFHLQTEPFVRVARSRATPGRAPPFFHSHAQLRIVFVHSPNTQLPCKSQSSLLFLLSYTRLGLNRRRKALVEMSSKARRVYLLIHTPTELGRPVQMGFAPQAVWSNALFQGYMAKVEENRKAGGSVTHLSKRDIERWGFFPPCGARVQVMEVGVPSQEWFDMWKKGAGKEMK